jgi:hypothetical protein
LTCRRYSLAEEARSSRYLSKLERPRIATSRAQKLSVRRSFVDSTNARYVVEPLGGEIVADFFDIGYSRSVP